MRIRKRIDVNSVLMLSLVFGALLALPGCNVNVKKSGEGRGQEGGH